MLGSRTYWRCALQCLFKHQVNLAWVSNKLPTWIHSICYHPLRSCLVVMGLVLQIPESELLYHVASRAKWKAAPFSRFGRLGAL